jgi:hypothetical protein
MNGSVANVVWAPLLPAELLGAVAFLFALACGYGLFRRARGMIWRGAAVATFLLVLFNPSLLIEDREAQTGLVAVVLDESPSQDIGERRKRSEAAVADITQQLKGARDLELRVIRAGRRGEDAAADTGTHLFEALARGLADVPRPRLAGVILVTDGQVHDVATAESLNLEAPVHVLLSGERGEIDRTLTVASAPSFGIVGKTVTLTFRVEDVPLSKTPIRVAVRRDGVTVQTLSVAANSEGKVDIAVDHAGPSIIELEAQPGPRELTLENNRAVVTVNGVRDRLKVLLITGEPHPGERTWRTFLKSDPSVDLVHFTILRPPEKQDSTPLNELSLITFPVRELFEVKLTQFDLVIFDRYRRRGVLPQSYFANIADYVRKGGALLIADGPAYASPNSLFHSPLGEILPAEPTGQVIEAPFRPALTSTGKRHPVTAELSGAPPGGEKWGRWYRLIEANARRGLTLMSGPGDRPLLVLDRQGEGRVAVLLSDHIWLWARGYEGGGPQAELLRRLAHWLMKEPELEENNLRATVRGGRLEIARRSLEPGRAVVTVSDPAGKQQRVELKDQGGGRAAGSMSLHGPGLYRVRDGERTALAAAGSPNPLETADMRTTDEHLAPLVRRTGGGVVWLAERGTPEIRRGPGGLGYAGPVGTRDWIGLKPPGDFVVRGVRRVPLLPGLIVLLAGLGALALGWWREGR